MRVGLQIQSTAQKARFEEQGQEQEQKLQSGHRAVLDVQEALTHLKATESLWQDALLAMAGGLLGGSYSISDKRDCKGQNNSNGVHRREGKINLRTV